MKKIKLLLLVVLLPLFVMSQKIYKEQVRVKLELSYDFAELFSDTTHIGTIKTHTNIDVISDGYFIFWSSGSERLYHFLYPNTSAYDVNRLTFTKTDIPNVYKNNFMLFNDSIKINVTEKNIIFRNRNYKRIIFHN